MCGIFCILSNLHKFNNLSNHDILFNGLNSLLNRGYDSVGFSYINNNNSIITHKFASSQSNTSINLIHNIIKDFDNKEVFKIAIGHTRWATHGSRTDENSHPHNSFYNNFSLVHNGIIENYNELKEFLLSKDFKFKSQTDSEVVVNLIEYFYLFDVETKNNIYLSIQKCVKELEGTYGLAIISKNEPNKLFCVRNGSPLLIGSNQDIALVTSEQSGFCNLINNYITLDNDDICIIENINNKIKIKTNTNYQPKTLTKQIFDLTPQPFPHWTIKEIYDQSRTILNAYNNGGRILDNNKVKLGGLEINGIKEELLKVKNIYIFGMGTSYHAGLLASYYFENLCIFNSVQVFDAGEFNERKLPKNNNSKSAAIFISQSGETKDLHHILTLIKKYDNIITIGVINVVDSLIAREVDCGVYTNAGREVAVASTKVFSNQVIVLSLIALWFSQNQNIHNNLRYNMIQDLLKLSFQFENCINDLNIKMKELVKDFNYNNLFILGRDFLKPISDEASLKIKEITYIHSESYSASSLKHGPFALLDENLPVFFLLQEDEYLSKNLSTLEEIHCRNSPIYLFTSCTSLSSKLSNKSNYHIIYLPQNKYYQPLLFILCFQLFAYHLSIKKGIDCDKPRNLAKTVTTF